MLGPVQLNKLEYCRKIRNLQLDCESSMKIIADNIYEQFGVAEETTEEGGNDGESQQTKTEK